MRSPLRSRPLGTAAAALVLAAAAIASIQLTSAQAGDRAAGAREGAGAHDLVVGSGGGAQPETVEEFLTAVTTDVDAYWTETFAASGLAEPRVRYLWIPAGRSAASICDGGAGTLGDSAAAYCPGDDTIYISEQFATDIHAGALDHALPGSAHGYGGTAGDFAVAYIVAHEYGHQIQDELGLFRRYGGQLPTMAFELQADCFAGTWARSAADEGRVEDGDVQEALDAALAVGDFEAGGAGHHGTPEQRRGAWSAGFESGDPAACDRFLAAA